MAALTVRLPESLHRATREMAEEDSVSINAFVASALGEKIASLKTLTFLKERAASAQEGDWDAIFALVPDVPAEPHDRFPVVPSP